MSKAVRWTKNQLSEFLSKSNTVIKKHETVSIKNDRYRNKWERDFANKILKFKLIKGEIRQYEYEPMKFRLSEGCYIVPDFISKNAEGFDVYEVKGFPRPAWAVKWKVFKEKFSWIFNNFYIVKFSNGTFKITKD
jgi:hypothetical protein